MSEKHKEILQLRIRELEHEIRYLEHEAISKRKKLALAKQELFELTWPITIWEDESLHLAEANDAEAI